MECEIATVNSNSQEIKEILEQAKTIAIIGLSPNEEKDSNKVGKYLQNAGYKVIPVYPKEDEILGEKVYRSLKEIPSDIKIDIVDIFRKPAVVSQVVDSAIERGNIGTIWSQLGIVNNSAAEKAIANGMKSVQNYCTKIEHKTLIAK
jgi:predicted CoA-binding protein